MKPVWCLGCCLATGTYQKDTGKRVTDACYRSKIQESLWWDKVKENWREWHLKVLLSCENRGRGQI